MSKFTRGRDGRLYNGKGTKGGLAPSEAKHAVPTGAPRIPSKPALPVEPQTDFIHPLSIKPSIANIQPPEALQDLAADIHDDAHEVEFANHNSDYDDDWMTLGELLEHDAYYRNNCDPLSGELCEYLTSAMSPDDEFENVSTVHLFYGSGIHAAVRLEVEGEPWVLDYTARQFDTSLPVPLMLPQHKWEALIDHHIWTAYKDQRTDR